MDDHHGTPLDAPVFHSAIYLVRLPCEGWGVSDKLADLLTDEREHYRWRATTAAVSQKNIIELENEVAMERRRADRYDLAEVFLEIGLVITSITLLSGKRIFWHLGIVLGVVGVAVAVTGAVIH